ncbi:MAG: ATP-binding protein [Caldilineaceae bacterium]
MSLHHLFPEINLKPNPPKQPLAPWNLPDTVRLFFWFFHDPFTLDAYVQQFAPSTLQSSTADVFESEGARSTFQWIGWSLWLQSAILLGLLVSLICAVLNYSVDVSEQPIFSPFGSYLTSLVLGEVILFVVYLVIGFGLKRPANGVLLGFFLGLILAILEFYQLHFTTGMDSIHWIGSSLTGFNLLTGMSLGIMLNTLIGMIRRNAYGLMVERVTVWLLMATITIFIVGYNRSFANDPSTDNTLQNIILALVFFLLGLMRPLDWLFSSITQQRNPRKDPSWTAPRVTLLPTATTQYALHYWLDNNWERGLKNASQVWKYTNLRRPVLTALQNQLHEFAKDKEQDVVEKVAGLLNPKNDYGWTLDDLLASHLILPTPSRANLRQWWSSTRHRLAPRFDLFGNESSSLKPQLPSWHGIDLPLDTGASAALAGFYYLDKHDPNKAQEAFQKAGKSGMAKEMSDLATHLHKLTSNDNWLERKSDFFKVENRPEKPKRKDTWDALTEFKLMLEEAWLYRRCAEASSNRLILRNSVYNRLQNLETKQFTVQEGTLIHSIAKSWREPIIRWFDDPEKPSRPKRIDPNPFKFNQPLDASSTLFIRSKEELETFARAVERTQPLLLYGQAGTGKSSLVLRLQKLAKNKALPPIRVNLDSLNLPNAPVSQQVLRMIGQQVSKATDTAPPNEHEANYLHRFHDFLDKACATDSSHNFVIVIDRFELALGANYEDIRQWVIFLSKLPVHITNLRIIFSGRYIPREIDELIRNDVANGTYPLKLSFLDEKSVQVLLNTPLEGIIARFQEDAVHYINDLTNGQPFLIQLLAHQVVNRFNERQKDEKDFPDPVFSQENIDVAYGSQITDHGLVFNPVLARNHPFWRQAAPFFQGLVDEALRRNAQNLQLLNEIAQDSNGLPMATLIEGIGRRLQLNEAQIQQRISELETMDLLKKDKVTEQWKIAIELFRIYLLMAS